MKIKQQPYHLLLLAGLFFIAASFLVWNQNNTFDIHLHDTYIVLANAHLFWLISIIALLIWALYLHTNKIMYSKKLTWVHVIITTVTLAVFCLLLLRGNSLFITGPVHYYDQNKWNSPGMYPTFAKTIVAVISVLLLGQIIFIVNLVIGLLKRRV